MRLGPDYRGAGGTPAPQSGGGEPAAPETRGMLVGQAARPGSRHLRCGGWGAKYSE
jgi:hypothetical protein